MCTKKFSGRAILSAMSSSCSGASSISSFNRYNETGSPPENGLVLLTSQLHASVVRES